MSNRLFAAAALSLVLLGAADARSQTPDEAEMAARVDALLAEAWTREGIQPAPRSDDAEFLRRAWLDLCGTIPPINDRDGLSGVRDFLNDTSADKRARLVERLLAKTTHANHFANLWKNAMLPSEVNVRRFGGDNGFQSWLYGQFKDNVPYNKMVSQIILAQGAANQVGPALFYTALELKPEDLAASTSEIFLGTQIQCAQCHDHPFDHWTRKDFWGYAAFFARVQRPQGQQRVVTQVADGPTGEVKIPETDEVVPPKFLGGEVSPDAGDSRRVRLARWLTARDNPYFARAMVNRTWAILFGRGLVDPVDDLGGHNPPSHPLLLDELTDYFVATDFDLNRLIRTLARTSAYQHSSRTPAGAADRPELFARMAIKSLTAEQLYDCLAEAMRRRETTTATRGGFDQNRQAFLAKFRAPTQDATEFEAGIPQALTLMNGSIIREATDLRRSDLLVGLEAPFFTDAERVDVLFLSTLSRFPRDKEREKFTGYVESGGATGDRNKALGDVLWAMLNSAEFVLNH